MVTLTPIRLYAGLSLKSPHSKGPVREKLSRYMRLYKERKEMKCRRLWPENRIYHELIVNSLQRTNWQWTNDYFEPQQVTIAKIRKPGKLENTFQVLRRIS